MPPLYYPPAMTTCRFISQKRETVACLYSTKRQCVSDIGKLINLNCVSFDAVNQRLRERIWVINLNFQLTKSPGRHSASYKAHSYQPKQTVKCHLVHYIIVFCL